MSRPPGIILASQSPRRADILRQLGVDPEIRPADIDESARPGESPAAYVERLARSKAEAIGVEPGHAIVIGGDTVVVDGADVLSKPVDAEDAVAMLMTLSGQSHEVLSGIALVGPTAGASAAGVSDETGRPGSAHGSVIETVSRVARTRVTMRAFDETTARAYVRTGEPMDKAGSYGIQGKGAALVERVEGDYNAVVGFPVGAFLDLLGELGWRLHFDGMVAPAEP